MYWSQLLREQIKTERKKKKHSESNYTVKQKAVSAHSANRVAVRLLFACVHVCAWGGETAWGIGSEKQGLFQQHSPPFKVFHKTAIRRGCSMAYFF